MRRKFFANLPNPRPILVIAPVLIVLALAYHFGTSYRSCSYQRDFRERLRAGIETAAPPPGVMRLADFADFQWDAATILVNYKPDNRTTDCPFGWDWSEAERARLVAEDLLTLIVFSRDGRIVGHVEYRADWAGFPDSRAPYDRESASFEVRRTGGPGTRPVLRPVSGAE
jgi:hypothetical protein